MADGDNRVHAAFTRPGVLAVLALAVGSVLADALALAAWQPGAIAALAAVAALLLSHPRQLRFVLAFILLFAGIGAVQQSLRFRAELQAAAALGEFAPGGMPLVEVSGILAEPPHRTGRSWSLSLRAGATVGGQGRAVDLPAPITVLRPIAGTAGALDSWVGGDRVEAVGALEPTLPGDGRGAAVVRARQLSVTAGPDGPLQRFLRTANAAGLATGAAQRRALPPRPGALLAALTLGQTHLLTAEQRLAYRRAGLYHIFSVSGLHTTAVGALLLFYLGMIGLRPGGRLVALTLLLVFFCAMVGMRPPVLRSAIMLILFESRHLLRRPVEPLAALGSVATFLAIVSPTALRQIDFQMSFLCILAMTLLSPWQLEVRRAIGARLGWGWVSWLVQAAVRVLLASCAIQLALAPVLIHQFGDVSLVAPLANMLFLALASFCFLAGAVAVLVGLASPALGAWLLGLLAAPLDLLDGGVAILSDLPFAVLHAEALPVWTVAAFYLLLIGAKWHHDRRETQPRRSMWAFAPAALALGVVLVWGRLVAAPSHALDLWFLDVGQGDAILVRCPNGATMLVDAGPPAAGADLPGMLADRGVERLDVAVATHADADHIGGMAEVLLAVPTGRLVVGGSVADTSGFAGLALAVRDLQLPVATVQRGAAIDLAPDVAVDVLHPSEDDAYAPADRNDSSVVLRIEYAGRSVLLTGDAETRAEESMIAAGLDLQADILKAGHHGSRGSSSAEFLDRVAPSLAILSCGRLNHFGHPHEELLKRLADRKIAIHRTDREGTIHLRIEPDGEVTVQTEAAVPEAIY